MFAFQSLDCRKGAFTASLRTTDGGRIDKFHIAKEAAWCRCEPCVTRRHDRAMLRVIRGWASRPFKGATFTITYSDGTTKPIAMSEIRMLVGLDAPEAIAQAA